MGTVTKSIGTSSRDYSTLQAWEDALPANLVTDGNSQVGECYNDSEFTGVLVIAGQTVDATHTVTLKCADGQSFRDHANAQTNALNYNQSYGVGVKKTTDYGIVVTTLNKYCTVSGLQIIATGSSTAALNAYLSGANGTNVVSNCLLCSNPSNSTTVYVAQINGVIKNCIVISKVGNASAGLRLGSSGNAYNCNIVRPSDVSASTSVGITTSYPVSVAVANCAVFGFATASTGTYDTTNSKYNCTDLASGLPGTTGNLYSKTYANQFVGTTSSAMDFRIKAGADLISAGYTDATNGANDILGTPRPQGPAYDIGAHEYPSHQQWEQVYIQPFQPYDASVKVGSVWVNNIAPTTPVIKICTSISPITFGYTIAGS